jgi:hypothetical protein
VRGQHEENLGLGVLENGRMDATTALTLVLAFVLIAATVWFVAQERGQESQGQFGSVDGRTVREDGDRRRTGQAPAWRQARVGRLQLRTLSAVEREVFARRWRSAETRFFDDPAGAVQEADQLLQEVLQRRGYPVGDDEHGVAGTAVAPPLMGDTYRTARRGARRAARGEASTAELRQAIAHYRVLFEEELGGLLQPARRTLSS